MSKTACLTTMALLFAFNIFPAPVQSYNCDFSPPSCTNADTVVDYGTCLVSQYSISLFIQCADLNNPPYFNAAYQNDNDNQETERRTPLQVLVDATSVSACNSCRLQLGRIYNKYVDDPSAGTFGSYLCHNYQPTDKELCCLSSCVMAKGDEHSIADFCLPGRTDLMKQRTLGSCNADEDTTDVPASTSAIQDDPEPSGAIDSAPFTPTGSQPSSSVSAAPSSATTDSSVTQAPAATAPSVPAPASTTSTTGAASRSRVTTLDLTTVFGFLMISMLRAAF